MTFEDWIAQAAALPPKDAAVRLWISRYDLDRLEKTYAVNIHHPKFAGLSREEAELRKTAARDEFEQQAVRRRLQMAHPAASDAEREEAIRQAAEFVDDCFKHWNWDAGTVRAHQEADERAARHYPGYQADTLRAVTSHVAFCLR